MRVAVVGGCGSGKSTVVKHLRPLGYDAYVVGQEHSEIAGLWRWRQPDKLVVLDVALEVVRARRGARWPEWLYRQQAQRLADARRNATVRVDTGELTIDETVERIVAALGPP